MTHRTAVLYAPGKAAPLNDGIALRTIFLHLEATPPAPRSIDQLAHDFGIRRRGLYDFISICCTFGICRRSSNDTVEWTGSHFAVFVVNTIRMDAYAEPSESEIKDVFVSTADFSIQRISVALVKLFFYLRVKFLDLRRVSRLLAHRNTKYKTMLRKVYTVATGLEILGIVRKTSVVSEIQLRMPLDTESCLGGWKVSSILNTEEQVEKEKVCERRRREFDTVCTELADVRRVQHVPDTMKPVFPPLGRWTMACDKDLYFNPRDDRRYPSQPVGEKGRTPKPIDMADGSRPFDSQSPEWGTTGDRRE